MSVKESSQSSRASASIFYFKWSTTLLDGYNQTVKANYLKPLLVRCTRARLGDEDSQLFDFSELSTNLRMVKDDREEIRRRLQEAYVREWTNDEAEDVPAVTLLELSLLYRLKTLVKMCENLSEILARMSKWLDGNKKVLSPSRVFSSVRKMFESVCAIGEVFSLTSINWKDCKYSEHLKPTEKEYYCKSNAMLEIENMCKPQDYCPKLQVQTNYFRTLVYHVAISFDEILEHVLVSVDQDKCVVRRREINTILELLPPQYLFANGNEKLSFRTADLLNKPPKNKLSFQMIVHSSKSQIGSTQASQSAKSGKVISKKYNESHRSQKSKSLKSDPTQESASKSKSISKKSSLKKILNVMTNEKV